MTRLRRMGERPAGLEQLMDEVIQMPKPFSQSYRRHLQESNAKLDLRYQLRRRPPWFMARRRFLSKQHRSFR